MKKFKLVVFLKNIYKIRKNRLDMGQLSSKKRALYWSIYIIISVWSRPMTLMEHLIRNYTTYRNRALVVT